MDVVQRRLPTRVFVVVLVIAALVGGFLLRGAVNASPEPSSPESATAAPEELTLDELLLIAVKAKNGITMSYDGITGPPNPLDHTNHITLDSFQFGVGRGIGPGGGGPSNREASAPSLSEITVTKQMDTSSASLFQESLTGEGHNVVLYFTDTKNKPNANYLQIELENVLISGFSMSSGGDKPTESISLNFTKITYRSTIGTTEQVVSYNLATNTP